MINTFNHNQKLRQDFLKHTVGDLVKLRKQQGITQEELDYKIGVADRLVSKWECGVRSPTAFNLYCWADALDAKIRVVANDNLSPEPDSLSLAVNDNELKMVA